MTRRNAVGGQHSLMLIRMLGPWGKPCKRDRCRHAPPLRLAAPRPPRPARHAAALVFCGPITDPWIACCRLDLHITATHARCLCLFANSFRPSACSSACRARVHRLLRVQHWVVMAATAAELSKLVDTVLAAAKKAEGGDAAEQVHARGCAGAGIALAASSNALLFRLRRSPPAAGPPPRHAPLLPRRAPPRAAPWTASRC